MDIFPFLPDLWSLAEVPTDWYGNKVIGKGTCNLHQQVYLIRSPAWNTPDCIWCYHLEAHSYGVNPATIGEADEK